MGRRVKPKQLVADIVEAGLSVLMADLADKGMTEELARQLMRQVAREVCVRNAKCIVYIPDSLDFALEERDREIWAAYQQPGPTGSRPFTGERIQDLAEQYGLSLQMVYRIISWAKKAEVAERQANLPGIDPA